ncbi:MAG: RNA polymerase sigma-54 factor, partial [Thermoanaerobaculia bacterium]|nr:RNA polymerase sigma-54 factor [Thermoanaerobaculia bacterium]
MALEQKLSLKLSQKLVMTPSLQQAIKLLQMTRMELQQTLTQELVENPVLEEADLIEESEAEQEEREEAEAAEQDEREEPEDELDHEEAMDDVDLEAYFEEYLSSAGSYDGSMYEVGEAPPIENTLTREPDLYDHLLWQLHMMDIPDRLRDLCELVIGNLDPDGFLVATREELVELASEDIEGRDCDPREIERAIELVRDLDPPGIACWELSESLLLQLDADDEPEDSLARSIVRDHWEPFLKRQFQQIAKDLGCKLAELEP